MAAESVHIRGAWTADRIAAVFIVAALPPLAGAIFEQGAALLPALAVALLVTLGWQTVFAWIRHSPIGWDGIVTAIVFIVMLPTAVPLWQIALALSFGVVAGEQIFGGRGRTFVNPAAVGLAFFFFSFPASASGAASGLIGLATVPGAVVLVVLGLISWRVIIAAVAGFAVAALLAGIADPLAILISGSFAFGLIFLGCDPVSAAATNPGRLIYGVVIGALTVALGAAGGTVEASAVVFAVLLGSIFAPVIDHAAVWLHARRRRRRHG
ncbi:MAG TPA: RnfABCDGE type electron transport complex subunit D [Afifellaceae bacterium]|jgi:Na+-transporting NADH:ubiquinone oxidoreductase subunit B|nr:RnfABCDGE type electron transport complex subunit D [Afifellaceae bacterium]